MSDTRTKTAKWSAPRHPPRIVRGMRDTTGLVQPDTHPTVQRRVFHVAELEKLGVSQSTSYRRARADGPWTRLYPGVVLTAPGPPTVDDLVEAAFLVAGPSAMVTGLHALRLHGLQTVPNDVSVHVLIPHSQRLQGNRFIRFERTTRVPEAVDIGRVRTAPLVRATADASRTWQTRRFTEELIVEATQQGLACRPERLREELDRGSRRGTGLPREILRDMNVDVRSVPELRASRLIRCSGLPQPQWNAPIHNANGSYIGCPDAWFDEVGLAVEIDSFQFHFAKDDYASTIRRNTRYATNGIMVVQILPGQLSKDPESVLADIKRAYDAAAQRERPAVVAREREAG